jgi:predicted acyltransferase
MRFLSVDFFRGVTIALMIVVNTPGTYEYVYPPLQHAWWHGCTPTDIVFPSFMFIIGVSMWFSYEKYGRKWSAELGKKILKRTLVLFLLGMLVINKFPVYWKDWDTLRIMGVMQRLGLGYCIASILVLHFNRRVLMWLSGGILLLYWAVLYCFAGTGADPYGMEHNAVLRFDRWLLGERHLWRGQGFPFDPEGVLSTLPAVVTVVLGWLSGELMDYRSKQKDVLVRDLMAYGLVCGFIGMGWDLFFPINKKLWTSSFVLYAGGISMLMLALSVWFIEVRNWRNGTGFFLAFGANSLFAYLLSEILAMGLLAIVWTENGVERSAYAWLYDTLFKPVEGMQFSSFLFAFVFMLVCWAACRWLFARKIYIKV